MKRILVRLLQAPIHVYRYLISPWVGQGCRFTPTCSAYALEALDRHGPLGGVWLTVCRLGRCHPWCQGGHDPVPPKSPAHGLFTRFLTVESAPSARPATLSGFAADFGIFSLMDTRRTILWVIFSFTLLLLWDAWQRHNGQPSMFVTPPAATASADAPAQALTPAAPADRSVPAVQQPAAPSANVAVPDAGAPVTASAVSGPELVVLSTDVLRLSFDPVGAQIVRAELLKHPQTGNRDLPTVLFDRSPERVYLAQTGVIGAPAGAESLPNHRSTWTVLPGERELSGDSISITFESRSGGALVRQTYTLNRGEYDIAVKHEVVNEGATALNPSLYLQITRDGNPPAGESKFYSTFTGPAIYTSVQKFKKVSFSDVEKGRADFVRQSPDGWLGMIQHYFVSAWVPQQGVARNFDMVKVDTNLYAVRAVLPMGEVAPGASVAQTSTLWVGPQDQAALKQVAEGLDLVVDYGWLTIIAKPLFYILQWLHSLVNNWGWAIVLLTVLIKLVFFPLSAASYRSMARMKEVTPLMIEMRERYKDDRQKLNLAMMELYREKKINPLGGCLPILVQIPVFIALYWVLLASVEMRNAPWVLWINDLAVPDPWFVLPAIMIATMFIQFKLNPTPPDPLQAKIMMFMPIIFGGMMIFFPAGLVLYWVVNNILSIAQQAFIMRQLENAKAAG